MLLVPYSECVYGGKGLHTHPLGDPQHALCWIRRKRSKCFHTPGFGWC